MRRRSILILIQRKGVLVSMDKDKREKGRQKKSKEEFNSITNSVKPENQNQEHNVKKEGVGRQDFKYRGQ
jgi:hypothetical protein